MSVTAASNRGLRNKYFSSTTSLPSWVRPIDWLALPSILETDQKFIGLHSVYEDSNFLALSAAGNYTVDWGDGSAAEDFSSGVVAQHIYSFGNAALDGTLTSGGYKQAIVTVTPQAGQNLTTLNLHKKHTQANLNLYTSGFLDIAIAGSLMTSLLIGVTAAGAAAQVINFRDLEQIKILSSGITNAGYLLSDCSKLASVSINTPLATVFTFMFDNCSVLQTVQVMNTISGVTFTSMFEGCSSLQSIPLINTASGVTFSRMFFGCSYLRTIPLLNLAAGVTFTFMFGNCYSLRTVPSLNLASGITLTSMFELCNSLETISLINTPVATTFTSMFENCTSLKTIPLLNTSSGTTFTSMFIGCVSLKTIPLLDTANGTTFSNMFSGCSSLSSVPFLNVSAATNTSLFASCASLQNGTLSGGTRAITYAGSKLSQAGLESIFNGLGSSFTQGLVVNVSTNWGAVTPVALSGITTAGSTIVTMASTTGITTGMQLTGVGTPSTTAIAVTTTDIGNTINLTAHGLSDNDEVSFATFVGRAVTFTDAGDTVNLNAHGYINGDTVSFATIVSTTGIVAGTTYFVVNATTNTFQVSSTSGGAGRALTTNGSGTLTAAAGSPVINKIYFVVGSTTNAFQIASTVGGSALDIITDGSATLRYKATVTAIVPNVSVTLSRPATSSGTNTLSFRDLKTNTALLKGYAVTG